MSKKSNNKQNGLVSQAENNGRTVTGDTVSVFGNRSDNPDEPALLEKGRVILELYTVESSAIVGGMGCVYRIHHPGWNVDLALK